MAIEFNPQWLISIPDGVLKLGQIILAVIVLICMSVADYAMSGAGWVQFVGTVSLICGIVFAILYMLNIPGTVGHFPWNVTQLGLAAFWAVCYLISMIVAAALASKASSLVYYTGNTHGCYVAAAVFCVGAMGVWGAEAYLELRRFRQGRYRQTETVEQKEAPPGGLA